MSGFAVHHGGLLPILKEAVELLFSRSIVKVTWLDLTWLDLTWPDLPCPESSHLTIAFYIFHSSVHPSFPPTFLTTLNSQPPPPPSVTLPPFFSPSFSSSHFLSLPPSVSHSYRDLRHGSQYAGQIRCFQRIQKIWRKRWSYPTKKFFLFLLSL